MNTNLRTWIAGIEFSSPILNASGPWALTQEQMQQIANSNSSAIVSKTCTYSISQKNPQNKTTLIGDGNSINCDRLVNFGFFYYVQQQFSKPYILSFQPGSELAEMLTISDASPNVTMIELNLACPNLDVPFCYDMQQVEAILEITFQQKRKKPIGVKLAPFLNSHQLKNVIQQITSYPISFIVSCNTIPNCFGDELFGGLGGKALKYVALGQVLQIVNILNNIQKAEVAVIGVGGIFSGQDVFDMLQCGAKAVQVGTCLLMEGPDCFRRLESECMDIMHQKGYHNPSDIQVDTKFAHL
jgi:dihydroorotate dehydrogenase (fumarate)